MVLIQPAATCENNYLWLLQQTEESTKTKRIQIRALDKNVFLMKVTKNFLINKRNINFVSE